MQDNIVEEQSLTGLAGGWPGVCAGAACNLQLYFGCQ